MSAKIKKAGFDCEFDFDFMNEEERQKAAVITQLLYELATYLLDEFADNFNRNYKMRRL